MSLSEPLEASSVATLKSIFIMIPAWVCLLHFPNPLLLMSSSYCQRIYRPRSGGYTHRYMYALTVPHPPFCSFPIAVLGIGERVGITPLGGLVACLYAANPEYVKSKYNLPMLREIENLVAEAVEVNIPFMNPITCVLLPRSTAV